MGGCHAAYDVKAKEQGLPVTPLGWRIYDYEHHAVEWAEQHVPLGLRNGPQWRQFGTMIRCGAAAIKALAQEMPLVAAEVIRAVEEEYSVQMESVAKP